jgi:hypothetical protein
MPHDADELPPDAELDAKDEAPDDIETQRSAIVTQGPEVGANGGQVDRLFFAVIGDTRPSMPNNTSGYPTAVVQRIFSQMETMSPKPQFVVGTGDYVFSTSGSKSSQKQFDLFTKAAASYSGVVFAAMGNHECKMSTATNCAGSTSNKTYNAFLNNMVKPLGKDKPYYTVRIDAKDGSWTSKFVYLACNAWESTQARWFENEMRLPTTHTFVVRHEPTQTTKGPCVNETNAVLKKSTYSLLLTGHLHTFAHPSPREIIVGTGGAPLEDDVPHGFATVEQVENGFRVSAVDSSSGMNLASFVVPF